MSSSSVPNNLLQNFKYIFYNLEYHFPESIFHLQLKCKFFWDKCHSLNVLIELSCHGCTSYPEVEHRECSSSSLQKCCLSIPGQTTHYWDRKSKTYPVGWGVKAVSYWCFLYSLRWGSLYDGDRILFCYLLQKRQDMNQPSHTLYQTRLWYLLFSLALVSLFHISKKISLRITIWSEIYLSDDEVSILSYLTFLWVLLLT